MKNNGNIIKILIIFVLNLTLLFSCQKHVEKSIAPGHSSPEINIEKFKILTVAIPQTNIFMTNSDGWITSIAEESLIFTKNVSSIISVKKTVLGDIVSPNPIGLREYLKQVHPDRDFKLFSINGLEGVRADFIDSKEIAQFELYLISEANDLINIKSAFYQSEESDTIIKSIRMKFIGDAIYHSKPNTVTIPQPSWIFSFMNECYDRQTKCETGDAWAAFSDTIMTRGNKSGIVALGNKINFDSISADGEYITTEKSKILVSSLNRMFNKESDDLYFNRIKKTEVGHTYLIRTVDWPNQDIITKVRVDALSRESITITYQKLFSASRKSLVQRIAALNQNTIRYEQKMDSGELTLVKLNSTAESQAHSSFNLRFSTSNNPHLTQNTWDLDFEYNRLKIDIKTFDGEIGEIFSIDKKDITDVTLENFPNPRLYDTNKSLDIEISKGKIYGFYHFYNNPEQGDIYGVVQVLDFNVQEKWVRLKFRRLADKKTERFQKWVDKPIWDGLSDELLHVDDPYFKPASSNGSNINFNSIADTLYLTSNPYGKDRGFFNFGGKADIESISQQEIESRAGEFSAKVDIKQGDVIGVYIEDYFNKMILLIRIDTHTRGSYAQLTTRYFYFKEAQYGEQNESN